MTLHVHMLSGPHTWLVTRTINS